MTPSELLISAFMHALTGGEVVAWIVRFEGFSCNGKRVSKLLLMSLSGNNFCIVFFVATPLFWFSKYPVQQRI